ncbi:hypothetical protein CEK28_11235 [Xenophilus sp. AP218F]|nr:hypothetical protein CEK28_11235 [Xenophilus sp. AP218F]
MKKTILAAAIAASVPLIAQADVTLYGSVRAGVSITKNTDTSFNSVFGVDDFGSRIGFKGSENLGNGLKTIWQVETGFAVDGTTGNSSTDSGTFANRESYVGLQGEFGKLRIGYLGDILGDTEATDNLYGPRRDAAGAGFPLYEATDLFGADYGDSRFKNSIRYDSPNVGGFTASLQYGAGEKQDAGGMKKGNHVGTRLAYQNSGFFGAWAFATKLNTTGDNNSLINRLEAGYDANNLYIAATYNWVNLRANAYQKDSNGKLKIPNISLLPGVDDTGSHNLKNTSWAINIAYAFGNFKPSIVYSKRDNAKINGVRYQLGATQYAAAVDYTVSKRTMLQAGYGQVKENADMVKALGRTNDTSSTYWAMVKHNF